MRDATVPPFRIRPYGPGLEVSSEGRKYELWDGQDLSGKLRVSATGVRIYDERAVLLGRLAQRVEGWELILADGTALCSVAETDEGARVGCEWGEVTLGGEDERLIISIESEPWIRIVAADGWRTETPDRPDAFGRWSDGSSLSTQTHPDAWRHREIRPQWLAPSAIAWSLDFPSLDDTHDRLLGGTLAYLIAHRLTRGEGAPAEGSSQSSSDSESSSGP